MKAGEPGDIDAFGSEIEKLFVNVSAAEALFVERCGRMFPAGATCAMSLGATKVFSSRLGHWLGLVERIRLSHPESAAAIDATVASCREELERARARAKGAT